MDNDYSKKARILQTSTYSATHLMMHQSCPATRFLRDSHPSIHFPYSVNSSLKIGSPGSSSRSASPNHSGRSRSIGFHRKQMQSNVVSYHTIRSTWYIIHMIYHIIYQVYIQVCTIHVHVNLHIHGVLCTYGPIYLGSFIYAYLRHPRRKIIIYVTGDVDSGVLLYMYKYV